MKKLKTINLKGKKYVQVQERVMFFNESFANGKIETEPTFNEKTVSFKAIITPDVEKPERKFTGHSFGILGQEKALEKLETVAVGRALAFMGIGIVDGIASADEIQKFHDNEKFTAEKLWDLAKKGLVRCSECGEHIFYEEYKVGEKSGQPKPLRCKNWQHKGFTVKKEKEEAVPF